MSRFASECEKEFSKWARDNGIPATTVYGWLKYDPDKPTPMPRYAWLLWELYWQNQKLTEDVSTLKRAIKLLD